jgi:hypothetical protein
MTINDKVIYNIIAQKVWAISGGVLQAITLKLSVGG